MWKNFWFINFQYHIINYFFRQCCELGVLGFDCEWVTVGGARRPIALLQLASHDGFCALFRLCRLKKIPPELRVIVESCSISTNA